MDKSPLKARDPLPSDKDERAKLLAFDRQVLSFRQTAEWGNHTLQSAFRRLHIPLSVNDHGARANMLEAVSRLHNLRTLCRPESNPDGLHAAVDFNGA